VAGAVATGIDVQAAGLDVPVVGGQEHPGRQFVGAFADLPADGRDRVALGGVELKDEGVRGRNL